MPLSELQLLLAQGEDSGGEFKRDGTIVKDHLWSQHTFAEDFLKLAVTRKRRSGP